MKLFPRHKKVLKTINRFGSCCPNLLTQASGVLTSSKVAKELAKKGLIVWTKRSRFGKYNTRRPPGWTLTQKGTEQL